MRTGKTIFEVGAGEEWDRFVARAVARNCAGSRVSERNSGQRGGHSGSKCWSVRPGSLRDHHFRAGL